MLYQCDESSASKFLMGQPPKLEAELGSINPNKILLSVLLNNSIPFFKFKISPVSYTIVK